MTNELPPAGRGGGSCGGLRAERECRGRDEREPHAEWVGPSGSGEYVSGEPG